MKLGIYEVHGLILSLLMLSWGFLLAWSIRYKRQRAHQKALAVSQFQHLKTHSSGRIKIQEQMGFRLSPIHRFEKQFLGQTGLWQKWQWIKAWHLAGVCLAGGAVIGWGTWQMFGIEGLVFSGFLLGILLPLQGLELWKTIRSFQLIRALPSFFGVLLRWAQIQPDIYFCFGQLEQSGVSASLQKPFKQFLIQSTNGVPPKTAFDNLARHFEGTTLEHFIKCLERLIAQRGDLPKLLQGFEEETYQLQIEVTKRKMTQVKYKMLINGLCLGSFVLIYGLLKTNRVISSFYVDTFLGKSLLSALSLLVVLSFWGGLRYDQD